MIEPRVGKVKTGHTTSGFIVIVPRIIIHNYSNRAYLHGYYSKCANMHIFTPTDVGSFGGKLCKFCHFLYFGRIGVDALTDSFALTTYLTSISFFLCLDYLVVTLSIVRGVSFNRSYLF